MSDQTREQALRLLQDAWDGRRLVLFLGAGVSKARGLPSWTTLIVDLIAHNTNDFAELWPNYQKAVAMWMAQSGDFTLLTLAAGVKQQFARQDGNWTEESRIAYLTAVQTALYRSYVQPATSPGDGLTAAAELIRRSESNGRHIAAVVTTNFDNLLEVELGRKKKVPHAVVHDGSKLAVGGALPILHIHGFIPARPASVDLQKIVFAEDEYHELTYDMFHWALVELVHFLRGATVLFVGCSMTDPNVRRLLEATRNESGELRHVALMLDLQTADPEAIQQEIHQVAIGLDRTHKKTPRQLAEHVGNAIHAAKAYEQTILRRLGVSVWRATSPEEIVTFLRDIGRTQRRATRGAGPRRLAPPARAASSRRS